MINGIQPHLKMIQIDPNNATSIKATIRNDPSDSSVSQFSSEASEGREGRKKLYVSLSH